MKANPPLSLLAIQTLFLISSTFADLSSEAVYHAYHDATAPIQKISDGRASDPELKWQPVLDFDQDSCYNAPAIDAHGNINPGLEPCQGDQTEGCRVASDLGTSQVYSRARCNHGYCAFVYDYYFIKDVALSAPVPAFCGHRHEWEHIVVFTLHDRPILVAASRHSRYVTKSADEIRWQDSHPKIVYHKEGALTHAFRFARGEDDHPVENHSRQWIKGDLISYGGFPDKRVRDKLMDYDFGIAKMAISDRSFEQNVKLAMGNTPVIEGSLFNK